MNAAQRAAGAERLAPHDLARIGIERPHRAGLLAREQQLFPIRSLAQDHRGAEVHIAEDGLGSAVLGAAGRATEDVVDVICGRLVRPQDLPAGEVEGEQGVRDNMLRKSKAAAEMFSELVTHMHDGLTVPRRVVGGLPIQVPSWL